MTKKSDVRICLRTLPKGAKIAVHPPGWDFNDIDKIKACPLCKEEWTEEKQHPKPGPDSRLASELLEEGHTLVISCGGCKRAFGLEKLVPGYYRLARAVA